MIRLFKHYIPYAVLLLGILDFCLLLAAAEIGWILRAHQIGMTVDPVQTRLVPLLSFAVLLQLSAIGVGVYGPDALRSMRFAGARLLVAVSLGIIALSLLAFVMPGITLWRSNSLYAMGLAVLFLMTVRVLLGNVIGGSMFKRRVMVLGAGARAARIRRLSEREDAGFVVAEYIDMNDGPAAIEGAVNRSDVTNLAQHVVDLHATEVVLSLEERRNALPLNDLLRVKTAGVAVMEMSSFIERETGRVDLDSVNPSWFIFSDGFSAGHRISSAAKRLFDIVVSIAILILSAPIVALFALLIKLDSRGPVFFRQTRVGLYGQEFDIVKLRSMREDAETGTALWAQANDPRVTRIGRLIRKLRIDELPQAWSVLKGEMSFVGPRPERPQFVAELARNMPYYAERHMVKPGITGWAQINYPYGASVEDARQKLEYDLYYAKNCSTFLDVLILLQTVRVILWPEGAR